MTSEARTRGQMGAYLVEHPPLGGGESDFSDSQSHPESSLVDSTHVFFENVTFPEPEETCSITVESNEMMPENLDSVTSAARFVAGKK